MPVPDLTRRLTPAVDEPGRVVARVGNGRRQPSLQVRRHDYFPPLTRARLCST